MGWTRRTGIMLCYPYESKRLARWGSGPYLVQPKLDGDRCRAIIDETGVPTLLSSEENRIQSVPHIEEQLYNMHLSNIELDGELYTHGASHQAIHGAVSRTVNIHPEFENVEYWIFDIVSEEPQHKRLMRLLDFEESENVKVVPNNMAYSEEEIFETLSWYSKNNFEGIIVRNLNGLYVRRRSTEIMKFKPRRSDYYLIVGYEEEISIQGEPKNSLGALILKSDENQIFKVGTGSFLTRENRVGLWEEKESLIGHVAHVKYQHLTDRQVPRFPVLVDIVKVS